MTSTVLDDPALVAPEASAFAAAVRAALDDLDPEERDDLTDGLEAELMDRVADSGADSLGDPVAYAEELRTAAGLPSRVHHRLGLGAGLARAIAFVREDSSGWLARHPRWAGIVSFLVALRPAWWVLRAVIAYQILALLLGGGERFLLPIDGGKLLILAGLVVLSVQFGRGRWLPRRWMRVAAGIAQVILIVSTPFVAGHAVATVNQYYWSSWSDAWSEWDDPYAHLGHTAEGAPVFNVYAYDAEGDPVPDVRLYDQDGNPLNLVGADGDWQPDPILGTRWLVPSDAAPEGEGWNVYPLVSVGERALTDDGRISPSAPRIEPGFPFPKLAPLLGAETAPGDGEAEASDAPETGD